MFGRTIHLVGRRRTDAVLGSLVFVVCFGIFRVAPIRQVLDSQYSMLVAENLLRHGDFVLDRYRLPESDYRLQTFEGHQYYFFPPGTSLLSVPFVAAMHLVGASAVGPDGSYSAKGELRLDARLAELLMAAFAALVFFTARLVLPAYLSLAITAVTAFGTQVFSTTSRSMWSDTWGTVLIGLACFLLVKATARAERLNLPLLATLEGLTYFVRPTSSIVLLGTTVYVALVRPKDAWRFVSTVACWLGLFFAYSWSHFHKILPDYYAAGRLEFAAPVPAFLGNLISPSRGLLVCVPAVVAIGLLLLWYRRAIRYRALAALAAFVIVGHLMVLSGFIHWWGGYSFGARLTASLVPWLVVLAIVAGDAARRNAGPPMNRPARVALASVVGGLCVASIVINGVGAFSDEAQRWNAMPDDIDHSPSRLWSWRSPQFLAPFVDPDGPFLPMPPEGLSVGIDQANAYLGRGWPFGEGEFRWTDGRRGSTVRFALSKTGPGVLELEVSPYLAPPAVPSQRLKVWMNGHDIGEILLTQPGFAIHEFPVAAGVTRAENLLRLFAPDAASPLSVDGSADRRRLGAAVRAIRWHPEPGREGPFFRIPSEGLLLADADADKYVGAGWQAAEGDLRWTEGGGGATVRFSLETGRSGVAEIELRPYLAAPVLSEQRLVVQMNGRDIAAVTLREPSFMTHRFVVPAEAVQQENLLRLITPDAASPFALEGAPDSRQLGVAVRVIRWHAEAGREGSFFALPPTGLHVGDAGADKYLGPGWSLDNIGFRWTDGRAGATVRFAAASPGPGVLELDLRPYLVAVELREQRLVVNMNGRDIGNTVLREHDFVARSFAVPGDIIQAENVLRLVTPDATSPSSIEATPDHRQLGVAVRIIRWRPDPVHPQIGTSSK